MPKGASGHPGQKQRAAEEATNTGQGLHPNRHKPEAMNLHHNENLGPPED